MTGPGAGLHEVCGHQGLRRALAGAVLAGSLPATLLLHGPRGAGKQRMGLWVGQLLLCEAPGAEGPCEACRSCRLARRVEHPDLHWYFPQPRPKGASNPDKLADALEAVRWETLATFRAAPLRYAPVEEPRGIYLAAARAMRARAQRRPSEGATQVFLVGDAETLVPQESSPEAANALLKLLEEPPPGTRFVLTSSQPRELLPTIRSRALPLHVNGLPETEVRHFLERAGWSQEQAGAAARMAHGCIGRALGFLPDDEGGAGPLERTRAEAFELLDAALDPDPTSGLGRALQYQSWGARGLVELLDAMEEGLRDVVAVFAGANRAVLSLDRLELLEALAGRLGADPAGPARASAVIEDARLEARGNVNPQLLIAGLVTGLRRALAGQAARAVS